MMRYDAHVHFDCKTEQPYDNLKQELVKSEIEHCMLILNSIEEEEYFWKVFKKIEEDGIISGVAAIIDVHDRRTFSFFEKSLQRKINVVIKLHPRITNIVIEDFEQIYDVVRNIKSREILIDNFIYGPQIKNHVGTELALYLAERLPDRKIVIAHAGGCDLLKTMLLTRTVPNIFYDYSLSCNYLEYTSVYKDMVNGLKFWNERIMFGTDYPDFNFGDSIRVMSKMCQEAGLSQKQWDNVFYKNAARIYERMFN